MSPAGAQVLDAAWDGRQQAASFFQASLEKERKPADWPGAIRELEKCIEVSPEPSWEASIQDGSGRWRRHYLPYYYLGRAYWGQGDCDQAVEWLSTSLAKGEVCKSKQGDTRELEKLLVKCEQKGVAPAQAARDLVRSECSKVETAWLDPEILPALDGWLRDGWWRSGGALDLPGGGRSEMSGGSRPSRASWADSLLALLAAPGAAPAQAGSEAIDATLANVAELEFNFSNPGARSLAMGGAFVGRADDASAAYANPAGLVAADPAGDLGGGPRLDLHRQDRAADAGVRRDRAGRRGGSRDHRGPVCLDRLSARPMDPRGLPLRGGRLRPRRRRAGEPRLRRGRPTASPGRTGSTTVFRWARAGAQRDVDRGGRPLPDAGSLHRGQPRRRRHARRQPRESSGTSTTAGARGRSIARAPSSRSAPPRTCSGPRAGQCRSSGSSRSPT